MRKYKPMPLDEEIKISKKSDSFVKKEYNFQGNKLICIGSHHTNDLNNPQFREIKNIIENENISYIVVEMSQKRFEKYKKENKRPKDERSFLMDISEKENIELIPGDLSMDKLISQKAEKYGNEEVVLLRVLMHIGHVKDNLVKEIKKMFNIMKESKTYSNIIEKIKERRKFDEDEIIEKTRDFVRKTNKKELEEINPQDNIAPTPVGKETKLNDIIREISYERDEHMINKIFEYVDKGNVLYVAGKNHIIKQEPFLRELEKEH